ncbi:CRISPR-associated protein Cas4 [Sulfolobus sp. A20]|uniref:CRISPR-associated protein Cas4 n=1 Tax=Saccharolobus sp. A20 TaxID=1891280 RepID=UPI000845F988|nr:CRISPR-associated protein Cas4 [Sulfolobus sp. A20]AOL17536.1 CRISPR-associated protein Cas4 [Sulfolobus sp. A20]TRM98322.1 CRISPR-associated protein Cas4 [Sulfolobus sp. E1]
MISGVTIKHYIFCPAIIQIESLGFEERITEAMIEGEEVDKEKVMNFLYPTLKAKQVVKKPVLRYKDLIGIPDYVLKFSYYYSPLDLKNSRRISLDHKFQILFYSYIMEKLNMIVKEAYLYYIPLKRILKIPYTSQDKDHVEKMIDDIRKIQRNENRKNIRIIQPTKKCKNCGFFNYCKPIKYGNFYLREI